MECLQITVLKYYQLNQADTANIKVNVCVMDLYCQFSGGGDISIGSKTRSLHILQEVQDPELSPRNNNESTSSLTIEGKIDHCNPNDLKYQLFANIVLCCLQILYKRLMNRMKLSFM